MAMFDWSCLHWPCRSPLRGAGNLGCYDCFYHYIFTFYYVFGLSHFCFKLLEISRGMNPKQYWIFISLCFHRFVQNNWGTLLIKKSVSSVTLEKKWRKRLRFVCVTGDQTSMISTLIYREPITEQQTYFTAVHNLTNLGIFFSWLGQSLADTNRDTKARGFPLSWYIFLSHKGCFSCLLEHNTDDVLNNFAIGVNTAKPDQAQEMDTGFII